MPYIKLSWPVSLAAWLISAMALSGNADCASDPSLGINGLISIIDVAIAHPIKEPIWPLGWAPGLINNVLIIKHFLKLRRLLSQRLAALMAGWMPLRQ